MLSLWLIVGAGSVSAATTIEATPKPRPKPPTTEVAAPAPARGPVTNLPLPRFVSTKSGEVNVRRGPSLTHRIDWVFKRRGMPVEIIGEYGHWRRVRDREGAGGWVHYSLLSGTRMVIVDQDMLVLHRAADPDSEPMAIAESGVIARLGKCKPAWCRITADGHKGWVEKSTLWGVHAEELRD
ncbi:MAG: aspartyl-trna synthetase [Rhodobacteraceae bacterium]|nr:aspartyl-trna synthetase [Paracoccaceae bacterium]